MKEYYIDPEELAEELAGWKAQPGDPAERTVSEKLGRMFLDMATGYSRKPQFKGYPHCIREDMISDAVLKMMKNLKNYDPERSSSAFNYFTLCCHQAFVGYLRTYYKRVNRNREYVYGQMRRMYQENPRCGITQQKLDDMEKTITMYRKKV